MYIIYVFINPAVCSWHFASVFRVFMVIIYIGFCTCVNSRMLMIEIIIVYLSSRPQAVE